MILRRLFPQQGSSIIRAMMRILPLLFLCAAAGAAEVRIPSALPPAHLDTESVTNAPLGSALASARFLRVEVALPGWTFSRDWTNVRLAVRGVDERDESVSVRLDTDPGVLILR